MDIWMVIGIVLLIAGFVLVGTEMVLPGFGAPGISGAICLVLGIVLTADTIEEGLTLAVIVIIILAIMLTLILTLFHSRKIKSPIVLEEEMKVEHGYLSSSDLEYLVGKDGVASTDLRPAGKCNIDGIEFDVRSEGKFIKKDSKVRISKIHENTLIVQKL